MSIKMDRDKLREALGIVDLEGDHLLWVRKKTINIGYANVIHVVCSVDNDGYYAIVYNNQLDSLFVINLFTGAKTIIDGEATSFQSDTRSFSVLRKYLAVVNTALAWKIHIIKDSIYAQTIELGDPWRFTSNSRLAMSPNGKYIVIPLWNTSESTNYLHEYEGRTTPPLGYSVKGSQSASINGILRASKFRSSESFPIRCMKAYVREVGGVNPKDVYALIYDSSFSLLRQVFATINAGFDGWKIFKFGDSLNINSDTDYWIGLWADSSTGDDCECYFDDGDFDQMAIQTVEPVNFPPDPLVPDSYQNKKLSAFLL